MAVQSGLNTGTRLTWPPSTRAGQRRMLGTRIPPSWSEALLPDSGQLYEKRSPPLSLENTTIVSSSCPERFSAFSTSPTDRSRSSTICLYFSTEPPSWCHSARPSPALIRRTISALSAVSPSAIHGQCGVVKFRFSSHGLPWWSRETYSLARSVMIFV